MTSIAHQRLPLASATRGMADALPRPGGAMDPEDESDV